MKSELQQLKIAEACGWTYFKEETYPKRRPKQFQYVLQDPTQRLRVLPKFTVSSASYEEDRIIGISRLPDYLNDLNAMHEAEKHGLQTDEQIESYLEALTDAAGGDTEKGKASFTAYFATAAQRAEAFLRAKGLWTEDTATV